MPTCGDYIMHFLTLVWKVVFAIIPPAGTSLEERAPLSRLGTSSCFPPILKWNFKSIYSLYATHSWIGNSLGVPTSLASLVRILQLQRQIFGASKKMHRRSAVERKDLCYALVLTIIIDAIRCAVGKMEFT